MKTFSFIAASSDSGKTTLIEKVVPLLKAQGLRVAVIKHASKGFELDLRGKDSWRYRAAGADAVAVVGPESLAVFASRDREPGLDELERMLPGMDVIITEGFRRDAQNRIEVHRAALSGDRPLCMDDRAFLALVSDRRYPVDIPWFHLDDAQGVADFIATKL
jgi:molybdopterin-guanine dinucleotide biosynthesis protein MobB